MPFASAVGRRASSAASTIGAKFSGCRSSLRLPVIMRETSSRSSISRACERALRSIVSIARVAFDPSTSPLRIIEAHPRIEVKGVRSSCESVARNSSFSRSASSACRRASRSRSNDAALSSSALCRAVTSRTSESIETSLPRLSFIPSCTTRRKEFDLSLCSCGFAALPAFRHLRVDGSSRGPRRRRRQQKQIATR